GDIALAQFGAGGLRALLREVQQTRAVELRFLAFGRRQHLVRLALGYSQRGGLPHRLLGGTLAAEGTELDRPLFSPGDRFAGFARRGRGFRSADRREVPQRR